MENPDPESLGDIMKVIHDIALHHLPETLQGFGKLNQDVVQDLQEAVSLTLACDGSASNWQQAKTVTSAVIKACESKRKAGSGWDSPSWQEAIIFAHLCTAVLHTANRQAIKPQELLLAMRHVDLAIMLGAPEEMCRPFMSAVEVPLAKLRRTSSTLHGHTLKSVDFPQPSGENQIVRVASSSLTAQSFKARYWKTNKEVVLAGMTTGWPATRKWTDVGWWVREHGHRTIPLEISVPSDGSWHEEADTIANFFEKYIGPSAIEDRLQSGHLISVTENPDCLSDACCDGHEDDNAQTFESNAAGSADRTQSAVPQYLPAEPGTGPSRAGMDGAEAKKNSASSSERTLPAAARGSSPRTVAYLAQHRLFEQVPSLLEDVRLPACWQGPWEVMNVWIGTSGTVTPLHYDSMDNFLCQVAGSKYVRLYAWSQTPLLYVDKRTDTQQGGAYSRSQGNISSVDVESLDLERFPLFADAQYSETILNPGDSLYIPAKCWHYVRSLSTSISVNFWF